MNLTALWMKERGSSFAGLWVPHKLIYKRYICIKTQWNDFTWFIYHIRLSGGIASNPINHLCDVIRTTWFYNASTYLGVYDLMRGSWWLSCIRFLNCTLLVFTFIVLRIMDVVLFLYYNSIDIDTWWVHYTTNLDAHYEHLLDLTTSMRNAKTQSITICYLFGLL